MTPRRLGTFGRGLVKTYCPGMARAVRVGVVDLAADGGEALRRYLELDPPPVPAAVLLDDRMPC